ncbi:MAG: SpoVG family protein [Planctomycetales bacterium]|nr:SpoVG family protein [Planctomycetales bacterium]
MPNDLRNSQTQVIRNTEPQPQPPLREEPRTRDDGGTRDQSRVESRIEFELVDQGKIRAFAKVRYGDFLMHGFKVVDPGDGKPLWVGMPSKQVPGSADGPAELRWVQTVYMPDPGRKKAFENWVLSAYREEMRKAGETTAAV